MSTYSVQMPSASANGDPILIGTGSTTLHTAVAGTGGADEVWVWAQNYHSTTDAVLTLTVGGINAIIINIPFRSEMKLVLPGLRVNNAHAVVATSSLASALTALVNVNRIVF